MIVGRFGNTSGRPYIEALVRFPRLGITGNISFLADTGADRTTILHHDGVRLAIDYANLGPSQVSGGIGGLAQNHPEDAIVTFLDSGTRFCLYQLHVLICGMPKAPLILPDGRQIPYIAAPSLLGRDIMQHWEFLYDKTNDLLRAEVRQFDFEYSLPKPVTALPQQSTLPPPDWP